MTKKMTNEEFLAKANKKHNNKFSYPDLYKKSNIKMRIICPKHGKFSQFPNEHLLSVYGCRYCANEHRNDHKLTDDKIVDEYCKNKPFRRRSSSHCKNQKTKLIFDCLINNKHHWKATFGSIKSQNSSCNKCVRKRIGIDHSNSAMKKFKQWIKSKPFKLCETLIDMSSYYEFKCKNCPHKWFASPSSMMCNDTKCSMCFHKHLGIIKRLKHKDIIKKIKIQDPNSKLAEPYKGSVMLHHLIDCKRCGKRRSQRLNKLLYFGQSCKYCVVNKANRKLTSLISETLKGKYNSFETEKTFEFDELHRVDNYFKIGTKRIIVQRQGEGHFDIGFYGIYGSKISQKMKKRLLEDQIEKDEELRKECKDENIILLEIYPGDSDEKIRKLLLKLV